MSNCEIKIGLASTERRSNPPPATNRRRAAFFSGRLMLEGLHKAKAQVAGLKREATKRHKPKDQFDRPHGGHRESRFGKRLSAAMSLARMTRKERNKMLARKCREAGVQTPMALALAK